MAPNRKPKKGSTRMDAAIEAMTKEFGFRDEQLIRNVANQLLQEYGGSEGWYFIEQYSYRELLEALLRRQNEGENGGWNSGQREEELNDQEDAAKGEDLIEAGSIEAEKSQETAPTDVVDASSVIAAITCSVAVEDGLKTSNKDEEKTLDKDGETWKDISLDHGSNPIPPPPPTQPPPIAQKKRPCYGWIDSDKEDGCDDFIDLGQAGTMDDLKPPKRRSRWDLRPEDP